MSRMFPLHASKRKTRSCPRFRRKKVVRSRHFLFPESDRCMASAPGITVWFAREFRRNLRPNTKRLATPACALCQRIATCSLAKPAPLPAAPYATGNFVVPTIFDSGSVLFWFFLLGHSNECNSRTEGSRGTVEKFIPCVFLRSGRKNTKTYPLSLTPF